MGIGIGAIDIRAELPRADWTIGDGKTYEKTTLTLHYNGPPSEAPGIAVRGQEAMVRYLSGIAEFHMGKYLGADGIQYNLCVDAVGRIFYLRTIGPELWHCGNPTGNRNSIAIHVPIGGDQRPTDVQWNALTYIFKTYNIPVVQHREWQRSRGGYVLDDLDRNGTSCPGVPLRSLLLQYRSDQHSVGDRYIVAFDGSRVREGPGTNFPVALKGKSGFPDGLMLNRNMVVMSDAVVNGSPVGGNPVWIHLATGEGFVHSSLLERAS